MTVRTTKTLMACLALLMGGTAAQAQQTVNVLCSTDAPWCELAAKEFQAATGTRVLQARKSTGEALAQLRAEAANPKTDLWWGGTGDPFLQAAEIGLLEAYRPAYMNDLHRRPFFAGGRSRPARRLSAQLPRRPARLGGAPVRDDREPDRKSVV